MSLPEYIESEFGGNNAAFARHMNVTRQQVTKWINDKWIVESGTLYAPRRVIPNP